VVTWVVIMVFLGVTGIALVPGLLQPGATPAAPALANLFLVHSWVPTFEYMFSVSPVSWSLSSEILFYALFPAIIPLVMRIPVRRLVAVAVGLLAVTWLIPLVSLTFSGPALFPGLLKSQYWFDYFFPPARLPEFVLGMVLARMVRNGFTPRIGVALPGILTVGLLIAAPLIELPNPFLFVAVTSLPVALIVLGAASMDVRGAWSWWRHPIMVFLGEISFALYMVHVPVSEIFRHYFGEQVRTAIGDVATDILVIALCVLAAWVLYRLVERPLMRRFGQSRSVPQVTDRPSPA
jgi:peptidoglycan/LPS O-acetylase OafA/YrhL